MKTKHESTYERAQVAACSKSLFAGGFVLVLIVVVLVLIGGLGP